jgi:hypothetical protein
VSGRQVTFIGDAMAAVVQGVEEVRTLIGQPPVVVGGLAVMCRLSNPYRATTDLDLVDRLLGEMPQLQVLRASRGAQPVPPASVLLPTAYGQVKVDVHAGRVRHRLKRGGRDDPFHQRQQQGRAVARRYRHAAAGRQISGLRNSDVAGSVVAGSPLVEHSRFRYPS